MTKREAEDTKKNLIMAGWKNVTIEQKSDGSWSAIGDDFAFRQIHTSYRARY